ncbi:MAG TPA: TlpA disulfide reductase family protein [Thermoanaerobaculia bacterium]|nr:TlpA disulfide reductase family protein [Thermoanaerobaculia bacterium]
MNDPADPTTPPPEPPPLPDAAVAGTRSRRARLLLPLVVVAALAALFWPRDRNPERVPGGYPIDEGGRPRPLAGELAPVTLVHFWATWCPPCRTEIPSLLDYARPADAATPALLLIAVADDPAAARAFVPEDRPILFDPTWDVAHRFGTDALPETHLVVGGEVVDSFIGATDWSDAAVRARVQKWTATPPRASP